MYILLKPINGGLSVVIREFEAFVKKTGLDVVMNMQGDNIPQQFVENVLQVYFPGVLCCFEKDRRKVCCMSIHLPLNTAVH